MDAVPVAFALFLVSCVIGFAWGRSHARRWAAAHLGWMCLVCAQPNEVDLERCWSCGRSAGDTVQNPSHIPFARRWPCVACMAWNGVARDACWQCGRPRT
jgi:hypothetical protein